jgi:heme exporter protein B
MNWIAGAWAVFEKDLRLELRTRYALNTLLMFVASLLLLVLFAIGGEPLSARVTSALLWIIVLFSATVGMGRTFVSEQEQGTVLFLQLNTRPSMVYAGKLLFNFFLSLLLSTVAVAGLWVVLNLEVGTPGLLFATVVLGALGLAGAMTLLASIIARTANQGPLFAVLSFPILVPLLLTVVDVTQNALLGTSWMPVRNEMVSLVGYAGVVITASVLLFDFVWKD